MSADFWAGYVSGAAGIIIGNPLDLIKTRLQAGKPGATAAQHVEAASVGGGGGGSAVATAASPPQSPQGFRGQFENSGTLVRGESMTLPYTSLQLCKYPQNKLLELTSGSAV